ncbi:MAG: prepilin peptidase [Nitrospinae bacterium]|nr:prepilin peptidase [Nitrospinota bacterium]
MTGDVNEWLFWAYVFIAGASVGSFLNVVIYRLPMNLSVVRPASRCPECGSPVRWFDNIPVISWFVLRGLCRDCGAIIPPRYMFVELFTAILTMAVVQRYGLHIHTLLYLTMAWGLVAITFIDLDFQIIPDELSVGGLVLGLAASFFLPLGLTGSLAGALVGGGLFFTVAALYPGGMGGGDIKLMAAIGAFLGWKLALLTIILGSAAGAVTGVGAIIFLGKGRKDRIPFGPFLALGALVSLLLGDIITEAYLTAVM